MNKKDFIALADAIREHNQTSRELGLSDAAIRDRSFADAQLNTLASFCQAQNPRFNRAKWLDYINKQ